MHMNTNKLAKRILCYGDSNTWGWVPNSLGAQRYSAEERWPGRLQTLIGNGYDVIEEGLGARTTMFEDPRPDYPGRNGLQTLPVVLETHLPLDFIILMLGTTDTKAMMNLTSEQISEGMRRLVKTIKQYRLLDGSQPPQILIVVPPIVNEQADFASKLFQGSSVKSRALIEAYREVSEAEGVLYLDPTSEVMVDPADGVHLNADNHRWLAQLIYRKVVS